MGILRLLFHLPLDSFTGPRRFCPRKTSFLLQSLWIWMGLGYRNFYTFFWKPFFQTPFFLKCWISFSDDDVYIISQLRIGSVVLFLLLIFSISSSLLYFAKEGYLKLFPKKVSDRFIETKSCLDPRHFEFCYLFLLFSCSWLKDARTYSIPHNLN